MEDPRAVHRFYIRLLIGALLALAAASILLRDIGILFDGMIGMALAVITVFAMGLIQAMMFAPFFSLMARLSARKQRKSRCEHIDSESPLP